MDPISDISGMVMSPVTSGVNTTVNLLPMLIGAIIVLIIGWIVGRVLGKAVAVLIDKFGIEKSIGKTAIGKTFLKTGRDSLAQIADFIVRIVIYLFAIMAASDILGITYLSALIAQLIAYIPNLVAFVVILFVGLILIDTFSDFIITYGEHGNLDLIKPAISILRVFLYFIVIMLALTQLKLDLGIIYAFITPVAWGVGIGIGAAIAIIVGFGLKDQAPDLFNKILEKF
jgi:small-conductance mechanosensitive channel